MNRIVFQGKWMAQKFIDLIHSAISIIYPKFPVATEEPPLGVLKFVRAEKAGRRINEIKWKTCIWLVV